MESRWVTQQQDIYNNQKKNKRIIFTIIGFILFILEVIGIIKSFGQPEEIKGPYLASMIMFMVMTVTFVLFNLFVNRKGKKGIEYKAFNKYIKTQEDAALFDEEILGNKKREIKLYCGDICTFTPHFLIIKKSLSYIIIKLQDVRSIKYETFRVTDGRPFATSFIDKEGESFFCTFNSKDDHESFSKVCSEQIPWAGVI